MDVEQAGEKVKEVEVNRKSNGCATSLVVMMGLLLLVGYVVFNIEHNGRRGPVAPAIESRPAVVTEPHRVIPGLYPVDVYGNFEKKGFRRTVYRMGQDQCEWQYSDAGDGWSYEVEVVGPDARSVSRVRATIMIDGRNEDTQDRQFMEYVSSVPYRGAEPERAQRFVRENLGKKAMIDIGGVRLETIGGESRAKLLLIYPTPNT